MDRAQWQRIAEERLQAARVLLAAGCWSTAYYVIGYAIECGLKSCILLRVAAAVQIIFEERRFSDKCWTHDLEELVKTAGLEVALDSERRINPIFDGNWQIVKDWTEKSRYDDMTEAQARSLHNAITDPLMELCNGSGNAGR